MALTKKSMKKEDSGVEGAVPVTPKEQPAEAEVPSSTPAEEAKGSKLVTVKMLTDYRSEVKKGQEYKTDKEKADELVRLGRAEYIK